MTDGSSSLPSRINGRLAACNACRSRKVACDHTYPVCNRCRKRKQASQCEYPVDERKSERKSERATASVRNKETSPSGRIASSTISPFIARTTSAEAQTQDHEAEDHWDSQRRARRSRSKTAANNGFFGALSHAAVFNETNSRVSRLSKEAAVNNVGSARTGREDLRYSDLFAPDREACSFVLRCLPKRLDRHMQFHDMFASQPGWNHLAVRRIISSLQDDFSEFFSRGEEGLRDLSDIICANTAQHMRDDLVDSEQWLGQFCGQNLRWESLGLLWLYLSHTADHTEAATDSPLRSMEKRRPGWTVGVCLGHCINLAERFTSANVLLITLWRQKANVDSVVDGDASMTERGAYSIAIAMITFLGFHAEVEESAYKPNFCSEVKRSLIASIFASDKVGVLFTGRPPLISRRYLQTPLPLDLSEQELLSDQPTLARAVSELDERGWNTKDEVYPSTFFRAKRLTAFVRDELIEVALGQGEYVKVDYILDMKNRQIALLSEFPRSLIYDPEDINDSSINTDTLYLKTLIYIDHLQNIFLAERLLLLHGHPDSGDLIMTSFQMVITTLNFWIHKDRFSELSMRRNFDWLCIAHGASAGGILCQELLRATFTIHPKDPRITRSSIIQQLSLLVGFLIWVPDTASDADLCHDCGACIQRVLDHCLNVTSNNADAAEFSAIDTQQHQPDFNFDILDTFEWLRTDF